MKSHLILLKEESGVTAFLTIIIIASASLIMAVGSSFIGMGELDMGYISDKREKAFYLADSCIEEAMRRVEIDSSYSVAEKLINMDDGLCYITVTSSGNNRTIVSMGAFEGSYKKIEAQITIDNGNILLNNWKELTE